MTLPDFDQKVEELNKAIKEIMIIPISQARDNDEGYWNDVPTESYFCSENEQEFHYFDDFVKYLEKTQDFQDQETFPSRMLEINSYKYKSWNMNFDFKIVNGATSAVVTPQPSYMVRLLESFILYSKTFKEAYEQDHQEVPA